MAEWEYTVIVKSIADRYSRVEDNSGETSRSQEK